MSIKVEIKNGKLILLEDIIYKDIKIKTGTVSDGGTSKYFSNIIFSNKDYYQGTRAFFIHDYMCERSKYFSRKYSTQVLVDVWKEDGLNKWKASFVKFFVNIYQLFSGGWKN